MPRIYRVTLDPACPQLTLQDAPQNENLLPFDGEIKSRLSPKAAFPVHQSAPVSDPLQFWSLAPGVIVYPEAMISEDDSPYYCWAYYAELLALKGESDYFRALNATNIYPHPNTGYQFNPDSNYPLFRLIGESPFDLFTLENEVVPGDDLMVNCRQYNLKGLHFEEVRLG